MRSLLATVAAALVLAACTPAGQAPVLDLGPPPTITPGASLILTPWHWPRQGAPDAKLAAAVEKFTTPEAFGDWLKTNTEWRDDYDTSRFLPPAEFLEARRGVCTAYARAWCYVLARQGIRADFVALWGPSSAHAIAVFRDPKTSHWRLASNQSLYTLDLGLDKDGALAAAGAEFYGESGWGDLLVFDADSGAVRQRMRNQVAVPAPLAAPVPGRNLFTVRR